jgi:hypothetical protein
MRLRVTPAYDRLRPTLGFGETSRRDKCVVRERQKAAARERRKHVVRSRDSPNVTRSVLRSAILWGPFMAAVRKLAKRSGGDGGCRTKKRFETKIDALLFASHVLKKPFCGRTALRAYRCPDCLGWHLTHWTIQIDGSGLSVGGQWVVVVLGPGD